MVKEGDIYRDEMSIHISMPYVCRSCGVKLENPRFGVYPIVKLGCHVGYFVGRKKLEEVVNFDHWFEEGMAKYKAKGIDLGDLYNAHRIGEVKHYECTITGKWDPCLYGICQNDFGNINSILKTFDELGDGIFFMIDKKEQRIRSIHFSMYPSRRLEVMGYLTEDDMRNSMPNVFSSFNTRFANANDKR